jgi:hypothetical protein
MSVSLKLIVIVGCVSAVRRSIAACHRQYRGSKIYAIALELERPEFNGIFEYPAPASHQTSALILQTSQIGASRAPKSVASDPARAASP